MILQDKEMKMKFIILIASLLIWTIIVIIHAYYSINYGLQNAGDGYDTQWQFQLMAFAITKLPFYILGLILFLIMELSLLYALDKTNS